MRIFRLHNDGKLVVKGKIIEDGGTRFTEQGNIHINELIEVVDSGIRYIRDWISGSSSNSSNHWSEIKAISNGINVALGKEVTSNQSFQFGTSPRLVTNGSLEDYADLGSDPKTYVQIDLGSIYDVDEIKVWHYYLDGRMYYDTKTEVSVDGINWVSIFDSTGIEEMYYHETIEGKTHLVPPIYADVNYIKIANSNMYVNELIEEKDSLFGYVLATDDDFSGTSNGSFRYIGSDLKVIIPDSIKGIPLTSYRDMFNGSSVTGVASFNKNVNNMAGMFNGSKATTLDLSSLETSNVTDMSYMFTNSQITSLNLSSFNTSKVRNMYIMFGKSKITAFDLSSFDTSKVNETGNMFQNTPATVGYARTQADADKFNASYNKPTGLNFVVKPPYLAQDSDFVNVSGDLVYRGAELEVEIPTHINGELVTSTKNMFNGSSSYKATPVTKVVLNHSNVTNMGHMFRDSKATTLNLSNFNTSNVTDMSYMFAISQATSLDLSSFDTYNVTNMRSMFNNSMVTTLNLSSFDTSNVTDMAYMFRDSKATTIDLSNFNTSSVADMNSMFRDSSATTLDLSNFNTSSVTNMSSMFSNSKATTIDLSNFDTSSVVDMSFIFKDSKVTTLDLSDFDTTSVTNMRAMFENSQATSLDLSSFNTSNVTDMALMFNNSSATTLDLSSFVINEDTNLDYMFGGIDETVKGKAKDWGTARKLTDSSASTRMSFTVAPYVIPDEKDFVGTANGQHTYVGNDDYICIPKYIRGIRITWFSRLFRSTVITASSVKGVANCATFNSLLYMFEDNAGTYPIDLSNLDVSNVSNFNYMFRRCKATSVNFSNWDTTKAVNFSEMFKDSWFTTLDLSSFDTSNVTTMGSMFSGSSATTGYARTQTDADRFNASSSKPTGLNFVVKP